ncbi:hypothetical protein [Salinibacillus kushneri]|uniref:hypothetical protein n=1 Tax=Salinibacillus kushneri TaxID=237682 RepID=UPI0015A6F01F|nr:hypothetical protein [Salinibacillus kushneri]
MNKWTNEPMEDDHYDLYFLNATLMLSTTIQKWDQSTLRKLSFIFFMVLGRL